MKKYSVVICGGGSTYTPDMLELLCMIQDSFPLRKVILYDIDAERQEIVSGFGQVMFSEYYPDVEYFATTDPEKAFSDIDFAFVQIRAGGLEMRKYDEKIPYKYGVIGQETIGPGGLAYGIRSVVAMLDLIKKIRTYSPDSWIINYSNPAAIVAEATDKVFPDDNKIINICDMPTDIMEHYLPLIGKKRSDVRPVYFGLNHYGWFTHLYDRETDEDLEPVLLQYIHDHYDELHKKNEEAIKGPEDHWAITYLDHLEMLHDFPYALPSTYNLYYLYPGKSYAHYTEDHTRYDEVKSGREKHVFEYCKEVAALGYMKGTKFDITDKIAKFRSSTTNLSDTTIYESNDVHAAYLIELVISIINNSYEFGMIMTRNNGVCENLSDGMMLECTNLIGRNGIHPLRVGNVPDFEKGLLENQYACEKLLVEATLEGNYQKLLMAFTENRVVRDAELAKKIIADFIEVNGEYWPEFK